MKPRDGDWRIDPEALRRAREAVELSQAELGRRSGIRAELINRMERGLHPNPTLVTLGRLCELLAETVEGLTTRQVAR